jgi:hypothetical protein
MAGRYGSAMLVRAGTPLLIYHQGGSASSSSTVFVYNDNPGKVNGQAENLLMEKKFWNSEEPLLNYKDYALSAGVFIIQLH